MSVDKSLRFRVMELMHEGRAPSMIDEMLNLPAGTAHDLVIAYWAEDKVGGTMNTRMAAIRRWRENAIDIDGDNGIEFIGG